MNSPNTPSSARVVAPYDQNLLLSVSAFADAAIGVAIVSPTGQWLEVNPALCEMIGYSEAELRSTTFQALTHPEDLKADLELLRSCLRGERKSYHFEKRYLHKDGSTVWGSLTVAAVQNSEGQVSHFIAQIQNISPQKQLEKRLRQQAEFRRRLIELVEVSLNGGVGQHFYQRLLDVAVDAIPGAQVGTMLLRDERSDFRFVAAHGYDMALLKMTYLLEHELFHSGVVGPHIVLNFDTNNVPPERLAPILASGPSSQIRSVLAIPVYLAGEPLAYIYLDNLTSPKAFNDHALEMAHLFGQQIAAVWQRLNLEEDLKAQRRAFDTWLCTTA